jgi:GTP:adenosylcobinamide-phosphate guanylyltransferase
LDRFNIINASEMKYTQKEISKIIANCNTVSELNKLRKLIKGNENLFKEREIELFAECMLSKI